MEKRLIKNRIIIVLRSNYATGKAIPILGGFTEKCKLIFPRTLKDLFYITGNWLLEAHTIKQMSA